MLKRSSSRVLLGLLALQGALLARASHGPSVPSLTVAYAESPPPSAVPAASASDQGDYLNVAGGRLYYQIAGVGPVVILVHDGILHSEVWDAQWRTLAEQYRVIRYDRREYGRSDAPTAPYSDLADLEALLAGLSVRRAALIGSSSGGQLALHFAAAHPEVVDALVLVGAVLDPLGYSTHFMQRVYANHGTNLEEGIARWIHDPYLIAPGNDAARTQAAELLKAYPHDLSDTKNLHQQPPPPEIVARWSEIRVPVLIVTGAADIPDVQAHAGALEAGLVGAQRVVLPGAGHLPHLEQPGAFNCTVRDFLSLVARRLATTAGAQGFESGFARVDGSVLYYEAQGTGEPLVLIHGGGLDHRMWDDQFDAFAQRHRVIRYDVRGHGLSKAPPGTHRDEEDLCQLLRHLGITRAHVMGLSLGGRIAVDFAIAHPDMIGCLIPVAPGLSGYAFEGADLKENNEHLVAAFRSGDYDQAREFMQRSWTDGPHRTPEQVDPQVRSAVRVMLNWGMQPGRNLSHSLPPTPPAIDRLAAIRAPTLAIVGALDMSDILKIVARLVAEIPGARRADVAEAAHMVNMERPDEFARLVLEFLGAHGMTPEGQTSQPARADAVPATPESVVAELYRRVTLEAGGMPDWDSVRALFRPEAIVVLRTARDQTSVFSVDGFIDDFVRFIERSHAQRAGFSERIVEMRPLVYGDIAHVLVLYEAQLGGSERPPQRGVDSIELIRRDGRWWIVSITNEICTPERPAPRELQD